MGPGVAGDLVGPGPEGGSALEGPDAAAQILAGLGEDLRSSDPVALHGIEQIPKDLRPVFLDHQSGRLNEASLLQAAPDPLFGGFIALLVHRAFPSSPPGTRHPASSTIRQA